MLKSKKHVFWEALLVTIIIFTIGLLIGITIEKERLDIIENYYAKSEVSLVDIMVLQKLSDTKNYDCKNLIDANIEFTNKIYEEAIILEDYENANRITEGITFSHQKYDLLRTFIWANMIKIFETCPKETFPIVYLYEYNTEDLEKKAKQKVWSRILYDTKMEYQNKILLLPIAADTNLSSVNAMTSQFKIKQFPCVIVGNEKIIYELESKDKIKNYIEEKENIIKLN